MHKELNSSMKENCIVVHYSEIGTKKGNRDFFEMKLIENLRRKLKNAGVNRVYRRYGRVVCDMEEDADLDRLTYSLERTPGVSNFLFAMKGPLDIEEIKKACYALLEEENFDTFRVSTTRSYKGFSLSSQEVNEIVGEYISSKLKKKVRLKDFDVELHIEICEKEAFVGYKKFRGIGGLPVESSGKLLCSLSGGIDSPVAAFMMMKRGCSVIFVHIYNSLQVGEELLKKIRDIVEKLTEFQIRSKLYIVPFESLQKKIIAFIPSRYRMIIYRRYMMRILNKLCMKEGCGGIVTGDSIAQVASQTVENLNCIFEVSSFPVFSPLIGMNKEEIVEMAKKIGTYEISIRPYPDCCSFMIAEHPETRARSEELVKLENLLDGADELVEECVEKAKIEVIEL